MQLLISHGLDLLFGLFLFGIGLYVDVMRRRHRDAKDEMKSLETRIHTLELGAAANTQQVAQYKELRDDVRYLMRLNMRIATKLNISVDRE